MPIAWLHHVFLCQFHYFAWHAAQDERHVSPEEQEVFSAALRRSVKIVKGGQKNCNGQ